jgi:hypothetical protein
MGKKHPVLEAVIPSGDAATTPPLPLPHADHPRPTTDECVAAVRALQRLHGEIENTHGGGSVLDSLVHTILSQNTTDKTSVRAFASLKQVR